MKKRHLYRPTIKPTAILSVTYIVALILLAGDLLEVSGSFIPVLLPPLQKRMGPYNGGTKIFSDKR